VVLRQSHSYYSIDFNDLESTKKLINEIVSEKPIHILINNSGGPAAGPIVDATEEQFLQAFNQHLIINHILTRAVIDGMKKENYGRIVNVISTSVKIPLKNLGVSNTIRGAVASWAKTMANELGQFNITVNNVLPGFTVTERLQTLIENTARKGNVLMDVVEKNMKEEVPMKRFGEVNEIAAVAAFLASPAASYVNGVSIPVDGGRTGSI
jgi:3-oxoacyl-[acyl-carrier protein] reductase